MAPERWRLIPKKFKDGVKTAVLYAFIVIVVMNGFALLATILPRIMDESPIDPQWWTQNASVITVILIPVALVSGYMKGRRKALEQSSV